MAMLLLVMSIFMCVIYFRLVLTIFVLRFILYSAILERHHIYWLNFKCSCGFIEVQLVFNSLCLVVCWLLFGVHFLFGFVWFSLVDSFIPHYNLCSIIFHGFQASVLILQFQSMNIGHPWPHFHLRLLFLRDRRLRKNAGKKAWILTLQFILVCLKSMTIFILCVAFVMTMVISHSLWTYNVSKHNCY